MKKPLPNPRECAECHKVKPIVAHGLCDACRLRAKRAEQKHFTPASAVSQAKGARNLATLLGILEDCKVSTKAATTILTAFMPFSGQPENVIEAHILAIQKRLGADR